MAYKKAPKDIADLVSAECPECGAPEGYLCDPKCPDYQSADYLRGSSGEGR